MAIRKTFDDMADRYQYRGDSHLVVNDKHGFGQVWLSAAFVDLKEGGDTFWLMATRKANDWHWIQNSNFILLVDGQRFTGVGAVRDSEVSQENGFFETKVLCNEEIHCGGDFGIMELIANSQVAKFRLGNADFVLPPGLISDIKEITSDVKATGGYGAD